MSNNMNNVTIEDGNPLHVASSVIHNSGGYVDKQEITEKIKLGIKFSISVIGIFIASFFFGITQKKITQTKYADENFSCIVTLVFLQCVVNYTLATLTSHMDEKKGIIDTTKSWYYICSSLTYLLAMLSSTMALMWVDYPTLALGKSAKPISVIILSVLLTHKSYPLKKYLFMLLVALGVIILMYKDDSAETTCPFGSGEILILVSLLMDGLTAAIEERMGHESQTRSTYLMKNMNKWSSIFLAVAVLVSGEYAKFYNFVKRHHKVFLWDLASITGAGAVGQLFIFEMVSNFGPLPCSIITTTRKFFTVIAIVFTTKNLSLLRQWLAAVLIFSGLFVDGFFSKSNSRAENI